MKNIWHNLHQQIRCEVNDSGLLKAVLGGIEFLDLSEEGKLQTLKLSVPNGLSLGIAQNELQSIIHAQLKKFLGRSDVQVKFESSNQQLEQMSFTSEASTAEPTARQTEIKFRPK